jgi:hypothetical protein
MYQPSAASIFLAFGGSVAAVFAADVSSKRPTAPSIKTTCSMSMKFSTADAPLSMVSLHGNSGDEWIAGGASGAPLWRLALRGPREAVAEFDGRQLAVADIQRDASTTRFFWRAPLDQRSVQIELAVRTEVASGLSHWQFAAVVPSSWRVVRADWPILSNLRREPSVKLAVPVGWGMEYDINSSTSFEGTYPSLQMSMPFVAFYRGDNGLYIGMHDKRGRHKHCSIKARDDGLSFSCLHWPSDSETAAGRYAPDCEATIGVFGGDYWNAAQIYRAFSRETPWGRAGKTVPDWLKNIDLWLIPDPQPLTNVEACRKAAAYFNVPVGIHWYRWHEIAFDTLYPDYFPAKSSFREGVTAFHAAGFRVMPYINGRLCDPKSKAWTQKHLEKAAARQENGQPYAEVYDTKIPLDVMCPATRQWQDEVAGIAHRLVNDFDVDGVYIDQVGAAAAVRCFSPDHGHSPGGGSVWFDGYRAMLRKVRQGLPAGRILTTEENAECWDDQFDGMLMVNTPADGGHSIIPLMSAVYADRVITFGFQYPARGDLRTSLPFRAKTARQFLWGSQLGWIQTDWIMADQARVEAEFLRNLAQTRCGGHEFFVGGQFLGEVQVVGDNPRLRGEGTARQKYTVDLPAVMATAWLSVDRRMGLAVVNLSDQARQVELRPPWHRVYEPDRLRTRIGPEMIPVTIAPRDSQIIRVSENQIPH